MKIVVVYLIYVIALAYLIRKAGGRKLSAPLYVPLCWMILILSRSLTQWLDYRLVAFGGMEEEMEGSPVDAAFLSILILLGILILIRRKVDIKGIVENNKALILLYAFALISLLWADFPVIALKRWVKWFGSLVMTLVILSDEDAKAAISALIKRCVYILIPLSIIFIKFVPKMGRAYTARGAADYHGVATQKNDYGLLLLICGLYLAWELIGALKSKDAAALKRGNYINLIFLIVIFWQLFFIDSKTPLICLILGMSLIAWLNLSLYQKHAKKVRNHIIALAICAILLHNLVGVGNKVISYAGRDRTLTERTNLWKAILEVPINPWVGAGWDNFWLGDRVAPIWEIWLWRPRSAHNGYIEIYLYLGWAGIAMLLLVLLETFRKSSLLLAVDFQRGCLSMSFFIVTLLYNYSESGFHRMSAAWFFFLLFSCLSIPEKSGNTS